MEKERVRVYWAEWLFWLRTEKTRCIVVEVQRAKVHRHVNHINILTKVLLSSRFVFSTTQSTLNDTTLRNIHTHDTHNKTEEKGRKKK